MKVTMKHAEHWEDVFEIEFGKESDRASVILAAAMLDRALETILKSKLAPQTSSEDQLLEGAYAPISNFSTRIDLAYRLGLTSAQFCRDLHLIRKIRNDFAHNIRRCSFEDSAVRARVLELSRSSGLPTKEPEKRKEFCEGCRGDFQMVISWMLWNLWALAEELSPIEPATPEASYWSKEELEKARRELEKDQHESK